MAEGTLMWQEQAHSMDQQVQPLNNQSISKIRVKNTCLLVELNQKSHNRIGTYRYSYDDDIPESFIHRLYFLLLRDLQ